MYGESWPAAPSLWMFAVRFPSMLPTVSRELNYSKRSSLRFVQRFNMSLQETAPEFGTLNINHQADPAILPSHPLNHELPKDHKKSQKRTHPVPPVARVITIRV
jgi:hypothetical protein